MRTKAATDTAGQAANAHEEAPGIRSVDYVNIHGKRYQRISAAIVDEGLACISVDGQELATFMCTPKDLEAMALGFLYNEQLIESLKDVRSIHVSRANSCVDVWLSRPGFERPERKIVTAGCGGGITFDDLSGRHDPISSALVASPDLLADLMRQTHLGASLYREARGIHTAALAREGRIILQVEDVGRHNCLDKLAGRALQEGLDSRDAILLSSGRISSEMINKARRLQTPIVCSRTSPTGLSVDLAEAWKIAIVAYLRQNRMRVYTSQWRVRFDQ